MPVEENVEDSMLCSIRPSGRPGSTNRRFVMRNPKGLVMDSEYVLRGEMEKVTHDRLLSRVMSKKGFRGVVDHKHEARTVEASDINWEEDEDE